MKAIVLALVGLTAGCIPEYRAPTFDQPHATLKLKRAYARSMGTFLSEGLLVDESRAFEVTMPSSVAAAPRTDTLLLHPRPARLLVSSVFFHEEDQSYDQATSVNVPYEDTESNDCGTTRPSRMDTAGRVFLDLRRKARAEARATSELLQLYALEGFLDRLAHSKYGNRLVLKGGALLETHEHCLCGKRRYRNLLNYAALRAPNTRLRQAAPSAWRAAPPPRLRQPAPGVA